MEESVELLAEAIGTSYRVQLDEGMEPLPEIEGSIARKYCGGGHGGYAVYLFGTKEKRSEAGLLEIAPWCD